MNAPLRTTAAIALALVLVAGVSVVHAQEGVISAPGVYRGALEESDDARNGFSPRYDEWVLEVPAEVSWRVVMDAQYDTYLEWTLPDGTEGSDDDGAEGLNAGTTFRFDEPTRVMLRASSFGSSARGDYALEVTEAGDQAPPDPVGGGAVAPTGGTRGAPAPAARVDAAQEIIAEPLSEDEAEAILPRLELADVSGITLFRAAIQTETIYQVESEDVVAAFSPFTGYDGTLFYQRYPSDRILYEPLGRETVIIAISGASEYEPQIRLTRVDSLEPVLAEASALHDAGYSSRAFDLLLHARSWARDRYGSSTDHTISYGDALRRIAESHGRISPGSYWAIGLYEDAYREYLTELSSSDDAEAAAEAVLAELLRFARRANEEGLTRISPSFDRTGWIDASTEVESLSISRDQSDSRPVLTTPLGHSDEISRILVDASGDYLITVSRQQVKVWDRGSGLPLRTITADGAVIRDAALQRGEARVAVLDATNRVRIWDWSTGRLLEEHRFPQTQLGGVYRLEYSPDDLLYAYGFFLLRLSASGWERLGDVRAERIAFTDRARTLVVFSSSNRLLHYFNGDTGRLVRSLASPISFDGDSMAIGDGWAVVGNREMLARGYAVALSLQSAEVAARLTLDTTVDSWGEPRRPRIDLVAAASSDEVVLVDGEAVATFFPVDTWRQRRVVALAGAGSFSVDDLAIVPRGSEIVYNSDTALLRYDLEEEMLREEVLPSAERSVATVNRSGTVSAIAEYSGSFLSAWDLASGRLLSVSSGSLESIYSLAATEAGDYLISVGAGGLPAGYAAAALVDSATGWDVRRYQSAAFPDDPERQIFGDYAHFLPGGGRALLTHQNSSEPAYLTLLDVRTQAPLVTRLIGGSRGAFVAVSPDGSLAATTAWTAEDDSTSRVVLWETDELTRLRELAVPGAEPRSPLFLEEGAQLAVATDETIVVTDLSTDRPPHEIRTPAAIVTLLPAARPGHVVSVHSDRYVRTWRVSDGAEVSSFRTDVFPLSVHAPTDGTRAILGSTDGALRVYDLERGELLTTSVATPDGDWLTWTPEGYFTGSERAMRELVYVVDGLEILSIDRFRQSYYRPDLVRVKLAGEELVAPSLTAGSARPPLVELLLEHRDGEFRPAAGADIANLRVSGGRVTARVVATDQGGGISAIQVQNNVKTVDELRFPQGAGRRTVEATFEVPLVDDENFLNAAAYSGDGILGLSDFAPLTFDAASAEPTLWIVAVGIDHYANSRYNLNYAVEDATAIADRLANAGASLFSRVERRLITTGDERLVGRDAIVETLEEVARSAEPQDVFVFFYSGHGIALAEPGELPAFHFVPSDVTQMTDADRVRSGGISGEEFAELVQEIQAQKQLHILDACNSGAAVQAFAFRSSAEEQALQRLSQSSGTALIAASRREQFAIEIDALGQGALTRALIDGLAGAATLPNGEITVSSLRSYVDLRVPELTSRFAVERQQPTGFLNGQDFPLAVRTRAAR